MGIQAILALVNAAIPNVASLVVAIKNASGGVDIGMVLTAANKDDQTAIDQATAWLAAHQPPNAAKPA